MTSLTHFKKKKNTRKHDVVHFIIMNKEMTWKRTINNISTLSTVIVSNDKCWTSDVYLSNMPTKHN